MNGKNTDERLAFLYHVHKDISEYIKFSDSKAGILLASSGVLLTLVLTWATEERVVFQGVQFSVFILCMILLSLSICLFFYSVYPRTKPKRSGGLVFWESILEKQDAEYLSAISVLNVDRILKEISLDIYNISKVAHRKYLIIKWGMIILGIALIFIIILWLSTIKFPVPNP